MRLIILDGYVKCQCIAFIRVRRVYVINFISFMQAEGVTVRVSQKARIVVFGRILSQTIKLAETENWTVFSMYSRCS